MKKDDPRSYNGLSALLEEDLSAFEFFNTLPEGLKRRLEAEDVGSFEDLQMISENWGDLPDFDFDSI